MMPKQVIQIDNDNDNDKEVVLFRKYINSCPSKS